MKDKPPSTGLEAAYSLNSSRFCNIQQLADKASLSFAMDYLRLLVKLPVKSFTNK